MESSPLRILSNDRNLLRAAVLTASSTLAVSGKVLPIRTARSGTALVTLTGTYTGQEQADYDVQVIDADVDTNRVTAPTFIGKGSGNIEELTAGGAAQVYTVELNNAGTPALVAQVVVEGATIEAREAGDDGNDIRITVDQSSLVFTESNYSLLEDLQAGDGGESSPMIGQGFDWDAKVLSADNIIPDDAHRVSFGDDPTVYLNFKAWIDGEWKYRLVPALARDTPKNTVIYFVTGGREVSITDGVDTETYPDIVTAYDLLNTLRTESGLVNVDGVVANDRTPTGQASRELSLRTDAHAEASTGAGSRYATGFVDVSVASDASTELITATCFASSALDHPLASLGKTRWELRGSLSGNLGVIVEGVPFVGADFSLTIPQKYPPGYGTEKGRFTVIRIDYMVRSDSEAPAPPICMALGPLGPSAVDQEITLTYAERPSGTCDCDGMPKPSWNRFCLGIDEEVTGDGAMTISAANRTRLVDLYEWLADFVRDHSSHGSEFGNDYDQKPLIANPLPKHSVVSITDRYIQTSEHTGSVTTSQESGEDPTSSESTSASTRRPVFDAAGFVYPGQEYLPYYSYTPFELESLRGMVDRYSDALVLIDELEESDESPDPKTQAEAAWDAAVAEMQSDVEAQVGETTYSIFGNEVADPELGISVEVRDGETITAGNVVLVYRVDGTEGDLRVRKYVPGIPGAIGFVRDSAAGSPATLTVYFAGLNSAAVADAAIVSGSSYGPSVTTPGKYGVDLDPELGIGVSTTEILHEVTNSGLSTGAGTQNHIAILADRYRTRLQQVFWTGGINPSGKSDASTKLVSGDGCWRDTGAARWWEVVGSVNGGYAPAFTNETYYSSRRALEDGKFYSSHEFGFRIQVKCPERLKLGDKIILQIQDAAWGATYQRGDELFLPIVAASPLYLTGGRDADATQTWNVRGSVDGPLADYTREPDAPTLYINGGVQFRITEGGIPYAHGDRFRWSVEGGHYQWRKNGGAWIVPSPNAIPNEPVEIDAGLSAAFYTGSGSSFVTDDTFSFRALQPWAVSNVQAPTAIKRAWKWSDESPANATLEADLGSVEALELIAMLVDLPDGATITLEGGDAAADEWSESLTYDDANGQAWKVIDRQARYVKLTFSGLTDGAGSLRYVWLGQPFKTALSSSWNPQKVYDMARKGPRGGRFLGKGVQGEVSWTENGITEAEAEDLAGICDYVKENDDEPVIIVPNITRTDDPFAFVILNTDELEIRDDRGYQPNEGFSRRLSATIPFGPVFQ